MKPWGKVGSEIAQQTCITIIGFRGSGHWEWGENGEEDKMDN
jgi:hypothetical protein